ESPLSTPGSRNIGSLGRPFGRRQRDICLSKGGVKVLSVGYDDGALARPIEVFGHVKAQTLVEVVEKSESDRHRDLLVCHVVVESDSSTLPVREIWVWLQHDLKKSLPLPVFFDCRL